MKNPAIDETQQVITETIRRSDASNLSVAACVLDHYGLNELAASLRDTAQRIVEGELTTGKSRRP